MIFKTPCFYRTIYVGMQWKKHSKNIGGRRNRGFWIKGMQALELSEFHIDNFSLKVSVVGNGPAVVVLDSHIYYPRTFSENPQRTFQFIFMDTRNFAPFNPQQTKSDFTLEKIAQDIEAICQQLGLENIIHRSFHSYLYGSGIRQNLSSAAISSGSRGL